MGEVKEIIQRRAKVKMTPVGSLMFIFCSPSDYIIQDNPTALQ